MIEMGARPEVAIVDGRDTRMRGNPKAIDAKWLQMFECAVCLLVCVRAMWLFVCLCVLVRVCVCVYV